ncbi:hypothetical protein B9Z19DRAFT_1129399 [Tuber borchii]|uniref:Uncharacterized protein n=1 Tax=Tuber borchii TaxID=42251 RepID=A0A2T6ZME2_TUBBO|nr:hypothetical protein B9Z19DRAFT_1129399 [Tuber borchii]
MALVIAALTLLAAVIPPFRRSQFRRWVSSFSILPFVKKYLGITRPNPTPMAVTSIEDLRATPTAEIPIPVPSFVFIYNNHLNTQFSGTLTNTPRYSHNGITGEIGRAPQAEEPPQLRGLSR